ncbi:SoxR reducing system RseC family protein [Chitinibacter sp. GC72]|uniref:SoxR reducing system RseC family protein n=1 Tax=Chitinibacter sp. GC72 TaxID=1526917 RepID=UPI0012F767B1|nr:SoxR reducing system RseC family protein [Chitinibacter sp. GC72]
MIETQAQVIRTEGAHAWIRIRPHSPCGNCDPETGCKSVAITRMFGQAQDSYRVSNPIAAQNNDLVMVAIAEDALLKTALWAYGLPMLLLLLGASMASYCYQHDELATLLGAGLGFFIGFLVLRHLPAGHVAEPTIIAKVQTGQVVNTCELKRTH